MNYLDVEVLEEFIKKEKKIHRTGKGFVDAERLRFLLNQMLYQKKYVEEKNEKITKKKD